MSARIHQVFALETIFHNPGGIFGIYKTIYQHGNVTTEGYYCYKQPHSALELINGLIIVNKVTMILERCEGFT